MSCYFLKIIPVTDICFHRTMEMLFAVFGLAEEADTCLSNDLQFSGLNGFIFGPSGGRNPRRSQNAHRNNCCVIVGYQSETNIDAL